MATEVRLRRGTASQHEEFTGAQAEVTVDTTNYNLRVHDGVTPGGHRTLMESDIGDGPLQVPTNESLGAPPRTVGSIAELRALEATDRPVKVLSYHYAHALDYSGGGGVFLWAQGDQSALVAADEFGGFTVAPVADPSGASGAWRRVVSGKVDAASFGVLPGAEQDNTARINAALALSPAPVVVRGANSPYRIDGAVRVPAGKELELDRGAVLKRFAAHSGSTDPLLYVIGSYSVATGGELHTENAHPGGMVVLGHEDEWAAYNALYWRFTNSRLVGVMAPGNVAIKVTSSQDNVGSSAANYFGAIKDVQIDGTDIGLQLLELANGHQMWNVQFWRCITAGYQLRGAYGNTAIGGFVHSSQDGVIGIQLLNRTYGPHDAQNNQFYGIGIEPGGAASRGVFIDTACIGNTIQVSANVEGGFTILNSGNAVDTAYGTRQLDELRPVRLGGLEVTKYLKQRGSLIRQNNGTAAENTTVPLFFVSVGSRRAALVEVSLTVRNSALDKAGGRRAVYEIRNYLGAVAVTELLNVAGPDGPNISFSISGTEVTFNYESYNNGTSTTFEYGWRAEMQIPGGDIAISSFTVLD